MGERGSNTQEQEWNLQESIGINGRDVLRCYEYDKSKRS